MRSEHTTVVKINDIVIYLYFKYKYRFPVKSEANINKAKLVNTEGTISDS